MSFCERRKFRFYFVKFDKIIGYYHEILVMWENATLYHLDVFVLIIAIIIIV